MGNQDNRNKLPADDEIINPKPAARDSRIRSFIRWIVSLFLFLDFLLLIPDRLRDIYSVHLGLEDDHHDSSPSDSDDTRHHRPLLLYTLSANFFPRLNTRSIRFMTTPPSFTREFQLGLATIRLTLLSTTGFLVLSIIGYLPHFVQDFLPALTFGGGVITLGLTLNDTNLPIIITSIIQQVGSSSIFFLFFRLIALLLRSSNLVFIPSTSFLLILSVFLWLITRYFSFNGGGGGGSDGGSDGESGGDAVA